MAFLYLFWIQVRDYQRPLRLLVTYLDCQPADKGTSLIALRLAFVNPASRARTVCGIDVESKMSGTRLIELSQEVDLNHQTATYSLPSVSLQLPFAETLQFPLDIPPNQSLSRWLVIALSYQHTDPHFGVYIHMMVTQPVGKSRWSSSRYLGIKKKDLAEAGVVVAPAKRESRTIDIYHEIQLLPFS